MSETLSVEAVQEWIDESGISCGDCDATSFTVLETSYDSMMEGAFESVSPHRAEIECDECGAVTDHSLKVEVVEEVTG